MDNKMTRNRTRMNVFDEVNQERLAQDKQWGGDEHDDNHTAESDGACWRRYITRQIALADVEHPKQHTATEALAVQRARYVKMAALAIAGIESIDRVTSLR